MMLKNDKRPLIIKGKEGKDGDCQSPWFEKTDLNFRQINTVIEVLPNSNGCVCIHCGVVSLASKLF